MGQKSQRVKSRNFVATGTTTDGKLTAKVSRGRAKPVEVIEEKRGTGIFVDHNTGQRYKKP